MAVKNKISFTKRMPRVRLGRDMFKMKKISAKNPGAHFTLTIFRLGHIDIGPLGFCLAVPKRLVVG